MATPSVSVPLEEGEIEERETLQQYANKLAKELHRVKSIIGQVSTDEIGARIEEVKISMAMYQRLFEILVHEHTNRVNIQETPVEVIEDKENIPPPKVNRRVAPNDYGCDCINCDYHAWNDEPKGEKPDCDCATCPHHGWYDK